MTSSALSLLGNSVAGVVLPLVLLATTGDALAAGALAIICAIPQVAAGVLGAAVLDRFNRRSVSVVSDLISAASVAALPLIDATVGLSFWWFAALGVIGAIGDVPGMTARDTLLPAVVEHDKLSLQRFMGIAQTSDSLIVVIGPAVAALSMGALGAANALWLTAALSFAAAMVTLLIPHHVGKAPVQERIESAADLLRAAIASTKAGAKMLFAGNPIVRFSVVFSMLVAMVMGGFQGLVLPVFFTESGQPELLGYVLSAMSLGSLVGALAYTAAALRFKRRTWYVVSIVGMAAGLVGMGTLPSYPPLLASAAVLGLFSSPFSALMSFYMFDLIPNESRGAALGTQNSLWLLVAPAAVFFSSILVTALGVGTAAIVLAAAWLAVTVYALMAKAMRTI